MVEREDLYPGVRVRIVSEWQAPHTENSQGEMDHWLGQIMTVKDVGNGYAGIRMYEDDGECHGGGWRWGKWMIECLADDEVEYDTVFDVESLFE